MTDIKFRSDMSVKLMHAMAQDSYVADAARVSTLGDDVLDRMLTEPEDAKLISWLMRNRHGSPFEHNAFTFFVSAPLFVFREFQRHRIASYNEESGRYKTLEGVFYVPAADRKLVQVGKPGAYEFVPGDTHQQELVSSTLRYVAEEAYREYEEMLEYGVAREVARMVLPLNLYSSMYVTMNARALMNFLSLRVDGGDKATFPTKPQWEIQLVAEAMEESFASAMPATYRAFVAAGRVAP